jgi:hypothetical protein
MAKVTSIVSTLDMLAMPQDSLPPLGGLRSGVPMTLSA